MTECFRAFNRTRGTVLCERLESAATIASRARGLLGRKELAAGAGLLFSAGWLPVMWMHMFGMRFAIDIVFLDRRGKVLKIDRELKPWRLSSLVIGARRALELAPGAAASSGAGVGDQILIERLTDAP